MKKKRLRLLLITTLALIFFTQAFFSRNHSYTKWISDSVMMSVFRPVGEGITYLSDGLQHTFNKYFFLMDVEEENLKLHSEVEQLKLENIFLKEKLTRQKKLSYALKKYDVSLEALVPAKILAFDLFYSSKTALIDKGSEDGIQINDVVLTGSGLVGRVLQTYDHTSNVLLLVDTSFAVDTKNLRTGIRLLVSGVNQDFLKTERQPFLAQVEYLENAKELAAGDIVVTSGVGELYPAGIPVGRIDEVEYSEKNLFDQAKILPAVDFTKLDMVFVLIKS